MRMQTLAERAKLLSDEPCIVVEMAGASLEKGVKNVNIENFYL
jgi:hypothetical protein